jgi:hypothetical protein
MRIEILLYITFHVIQVNDCEKFAELILSKGLKGLPQNFYLYNKPEIMYGMTLLKTKELLPFRHF